MVELNPFVIFIAAIFTNNMILSNFLGMCSFIAVSREIPTALGLGQAVTVVLGFTSIINYLIYHYVLVPLELEYLRFIVFIVSIAALGTIIGNDIRKVFTKFILCLGNISTINNSKLCNIGSIFIYDYS